MQIESTIRKEQKNVCIIGKYPYPLDTRMVQQAKVLHNNGIHAYIFSLLCDGESPIEVQDGLTIYRLMKKEPKENFLKYIVSTALFGIIASRRLLLLSLRKPMDIVIIHTLPEYLLLFVAWTRLTGAKLVLDGRDLTVDLLESRWRGVAVKLLKPIARILERVVISICCEVITASNGFKRALVARGINEHKITILFNTADTSVFIPSKNRSYSVGTDGNLRLIYHGTVAYRFGVLVAIKAIAHIRNRYPGVTLIIYGVWDSEYKKAIDQVIQILGIEHHVQFNSVVPIKEINKILETVHLGIVPYLSDSFMNKALSTKTFEYIAAGVPVVASRLLPSTELFGDDCIMYAEPGNDADLAEKIITLAGNPLLQKEKSLRAYAKFQEYSDLVMGERFNKLIQKIMYPRIQTSVEQQHNS